MEITRRQAIVLATAAGLASLTGVVQRAMAANKRHALYGTWHVQCPDPKKHVDVVDDGTKQHECETCGKQCFVDGKVTVMCPDKHANEVNLADVDYLKSYKCTTKDCGKECAGWK